MSKRNLLNLGLFVFILVLIMLVAYEPGKDKDIIPTTLTNLKSSDIFHIKINRHSTDKSQQELEFKKTSAGWIMLKPYEISANTFRINSILEILSTVSFSQNDLSNLNPDTFGLTKPIVTITFNNKTSLIFGHNKSLKNHRYIKIGSTLHMTSDIFLYKLSAKSESYINHKLLNDNKIVKLTLPSLSLEKTDGTWTSSPKNNNLSADSINQLINEWQLSQAYDLNKLKLITKSKADITIQYENNETTRFKIEKNTKSFNLINLNNGIRYILSSGRKDKLLKLAPITQEE